MRLFVAIELPAWERQRLSELPARQDWLGLDRAGLNWIRAENLHITIKFLGSVPDERVPEICQALGDIHLPGPVRITIGYAAFLPPRGPLRVFVARVGGDLDRLADLQSHIERALEPLGFPRERRRFTPHVTLARPRREPRVPHDFREDVEEHPGPPGGSFPVDSFVLMNSDLKPTGPVYSVLARFPLGR